MFQARADYASVRPDDIVGTLALRQVAGALEAENVRAVAAWLEER